MTTNPAERARLLMRAVEDEVEKDRRSALRVARKMAKLRKLKAAVRSGKPTPRPLRDEDVDERLFRGIKASMTDKEAVILTNRGGPLVEDFRRQKTRKHLPQGDASAPRSRTFWTPTWDHTGDRMKALSWSMVMMERQAYSMSINLGDDVISLISSKGPGFAKRMGERITTYLRRYLTDHDVPAPEFFFWVEKETLGPIHLHGAISLPLNDLDAVAAARRALDAAAGNWKPHAGQNKVHLKPLYTPLRWLQYITKWERGTRIQLGDSNIVAASSGLRREAKRWYEAARTSDTPISS